MTRNLRNQNSDDQSDNHGASSQDLEWLAFRYVSDEMSDLEREQFEKRLEHELDAQTALVDAMQSTQLIYAALDADKQTVQLPDRSPTATRPLLGRRSALLAAAAAILLMVAGWAVYNGNQNQSGVAGNNSNSTELAVAWADTLAERDLVLIESELDELAEDEFVDFITDEPMEDSEDWMYIALVDMEESAEALE